MIARLSRQPVVPLPTVPTWWTTMGKSSKAGTGGTLVVKIRWFEGMVVADHGRPLSPWHRTVTALMVSLAEEGVWLEGVTWVAVDGAVGEGTVGLDT